MRVFHLAVVLHHEVKHAARAGQSEHLSVHIEDGHVAVALHGDGGNRGCCWITFVDLSLIHI